MINERSIRVRAHESMYSGKGWLVSASNKNSFPTRIFVRTRAAAEIVRDALWLQAKCEQAIDAALDLEGAA